MRIRLFDRSELARGFGLFVKPDKAERLDEFMKAFADIHFDMHGNCVAQATFSSGVNDVGIDRNEWRQSRKCAYSGGRA
jgi:hypothetical protein